MKKDKEITQEIKIPRKLTSKKDYNDGFENETAEIGATKKKRTFKLSKKNIILICSISGGVIIVFTIILLLTLIPKNASGKVVSTSTISTTQYSTRTTTEKTTIQVAVEVETDKKETTNPEPTTTETATILVEETTAEPTTVETSTASPETKNTNKEKCIEVSNIIIYVDPKNKNMAIPKITGMFTGYSAEELLGLVNVKTDSGNPKTSLPLLDDKGNFTFNIDISDCKGNLHIDLENYYFDQSIESLKNVE